MGLGAGLGHVLGRGMGVDGGQEEAGDMCSAPSAASAMAALSLLQALPFQLLFRPPQIPSPAAAVVKRSSSLFCGTIWHLLSNLAWQLNLPLGCKRLLICIRKTFLCLAFLCLLLSL